jgi:hypothetical protein
VLLGTGRAALGAAEETWGPGWLKKMFVDEDEAPWAVGYMAKVKVKGLMTGYPGGVFKPNSNVTRAELVAAAVRLIGAENQARAASSATLPFADASYIQRYYQWAVGYLWVGMNRGLIPSSTGSFGPYLQATRLWAAEVFVRALGLNSEAVAKTDAVLPFTDRYLVPSDKVGYVAVVSDRGIMEGWADMFRPDQPITRAEIAAILDRCDERMAPRATSELRGVIEAVDPDDLELTVKAYDPKWWESGGGSAAYSGKVTMAVMPGALILVDKKHAELSDLQKGEWVMVLKSGSQASVIDAHTTKVRGWPGYGESPIGATTSSRTVSGVIRSVGLGRYPTIKIRDEDWETTTYDVSDDCIVKRNGRTADLEDLEVGDSVTLKIEDDEVVRITAEEEEEEEPDEVVVGVVVAVSLSRSRISVEIEDGKVRTITVADDAEITRDGEPIDLDEIEEDDEVEVEILDSEAIRVTVESESSGEQTGTVTRVRTSTTPWKIYIQTATGSIRSFEVSSGVKVSFGEMSLAFDDLVEDDKVTLGFLGSRVKTITVTRRPSSDVSGTIVSVTEDDDLYVVKIRKSDGTSVSYRVSPEVVVKRGAVSLRMRDIEEGDKVTLRLAADIVVRITLLD